jgi:hypothetical protein
MNTIAVAKGPYNSTEESPSALKSNFIWTIILRNSTSAFEELKKTLMYPIETSSYI